MDNKKIQDTAKRHVAKQKKGRNAVMAFISGGLVGAFGQGLLYVYMELFSYTDKEAMPLVVVTVILIAAIATGLGVYDKLAQHCGAGLFIPITGFSNSLTSAALEGKSEGLIHGIGSGMFKLAGSVLTYGIVSAFVFGTIRFVLFGG